MSTAALSQSFLTHAIKDVQTPYFDSYGHQCRTVKRPNAAFLFKDEMVPQTQKSSSNMHLKDSRSNRLSTPSIRRATEVSHSSQVT